MNRRFRRRRTPSSKSQAFGSPHRAETRNARRGTWREPLGSVVAASAGSTLVDWFRGLTSSSAARRKPDPVGTSRPLGAFEPLEAQHFLFTSRRLHPFDFGRTRETRNRGPTCFAVGRFESDLDRRVHLSHEQSHASP